MKKNDQLVFSKLAAGRFPEMARSARSSPATSNPSSDDPHLKPIDT